MCQCGQSNTLHQIFNDASICGGFKIPFEVKKLFKIHWNNLEKGGNDFAKIWEICTFFQGFIYYGFDASESGSAKFHLYIWWLYYAWIEKMILGDLGD